MKQALATLESTFDFCVPEIVEGPQNKDLRFMCHLWEPLRVIHKPLAYVIVMEASTGASIVILSLLGFRKYSTATFTYWAKNVKKPINLKATVRRPNSALSTSVLPLGSPCLLLGAACERCMTYRSNAGWACYCGHRSARPRITDQRGYSTALVHRECRAPALPHR